MEDPLKEITQQGTMVHKDAELTEETAERVEELNEKGSAPMFLSEELADDLNSNQGFAEAIHNTRSERSQAADEARQAETVFDEPLSDEELDTWKENPDEVDIEGVDTDENILFTGEDY